jgi:hypothetical protein
VEADERTVLPLPAKITDAPIADTSTFATSDTSSFAITSDAWPQPTIANAVWLGGHKERRRVE